MATPSIKTQPRLKSIPAQHTDVSQPLYRCLRAFSFDPLLATELDALGVEQLTLQVPWEKLDPGPVGKYLQVVDYDPASASFYAPVDLDHPHLLAQHGLPVSEGEPRFHQQMVYAVAMNTIQQFERALGRAALWAPRLVRKNSKVVEHQFVPRLRVYPHGLRQANAYYDPERKALLFGYFPARGAEVGRNLPGGTIFTCLSFDIIAHETTHALLDGLHRYFTEPSNPDVYAFHEAFADVAALFQHFSHPEVLRHQLARSRGDLRNESLLGVLAAQFGEALGNRGLRHYLGTKVRRRGKEIWEPLQPDPAAINQVYEPHDRGAILVAALFRAFVNIYESRVRDLRGIASNGTGRLPDGDLHPDLVNRLAEEAAKASRHLLTMCVRALDYVPPVDVTFGEYLRALITADYDLVRDDDRRYRVSVVSAFRDWGIYPRDVRSLSIDSLLWNSPEPASLRDVNEFFAANPLQCWDLQCDRAQAFQSMRHLSAKFHDWLAKKADGHGQFFGLSLDARTAPRSIRFDAKQKPIFEVHSLRPCRRIGPDGQQLTDAVVEIVQRRKGFFDEDQQRAVDQGKVRYDDAVKDFTFRGGCTLVIDTQKGEIRYCVRKAVHTPRDERLRQERQYRQGSFGDRVGGVYLADDDDRNPFAFLHRNH